MTSQAAIIIDDTDPRIHYSRGQWRLDGGANEYNRTTHNSVIPGATFTFNFTGNIIGTSVKVIGTLPYGTPSNSSYTIDGGEPVFYSGILTTSQYQQTFYSSPDLKNTEHTLVGNCTSNTFVWIDFLIVASAPVHNLNSSGLAPQQNHTEAGISSKPTRYPMGPIAVAFAIGVALTLLILGTFVFCRRYLRKSTQHDELAIQPFALIEPTMSASSTLSASTTSPGHRHLTHIVPPRKSRPAIRRPLSDPITPMRQPPPAYS